MKGKNLNIVYVFSVLFLLLIGIQGYFMYKSYQLRKREIYQDVTYKISRQMDLWEHSIGVQGAFDTKMIELVSEVKNDKTTKEKFLKFFEENDRKNKKSFSDFINGIVVKDGYKVALRVQVTAVYPLPSFENMFLKPFTVYSTESDVENPGLVSTGNWESTNSKNDFIDGESEYSGDSFRVLSETQYEVKNVRYIVFKDLWILMLSSVLLLAGVLWIFIITIKNLLKQEKQVEVLHTVVDNISHEFKTPIATLKIASKSFKKNFNEDNLPLIDRQVERLESLMKQLNSSGNEDQNNENIQVEDWVFFVDDLKITFPEVAFIVDSLVSKEIIFSKSEMESIIKNLAENAAKYGASKVKIFINEQKNILEIEVSDNGMGIPKSEQDNIFEKFYRIQSNNIHNTKGLGLGLFLVKNIIEKHSGSISLESEVNKGTIFKIKLPYES